MGQETVSKRGSPKVCFTKTRKQKFSEYFFPGTDVKYDGKISLSFVPGKSKFVHGFLVKRYYDTIFLLNEDGDSTCPINKMETRLAFYCFDSFISE